MFCAISFDCSHFENEINSLLMDSPEIFKGSKGDVFQRILSLPDVLVFTERSRTLTTDGCYEIVVEVKLRCDIKTLISTVFTG